MAFIVFEGLDGSGKSTQMELLAKFLREKLGEKKHVVVTREPGGTALAEELREILLRIQNEVPSPRCELLVYEASRAQHVSEVIQPALDRGDWVLCDRFTASSVAFQSGGRSISKPEVDWMNDFATGGLIPDLNILIDVSVDESAKRRSKRSADGGEAQDRLESEKRQFHEQVRQSYLDQSRGAANWLVVDGSLSVEGIFSEIKTELAKRKWLEF
ncbi:dTMP kinase [Candidatus Kaiserbacteria bacterium]|nr:MAG: dTMP kinase [Candidatus Kaiserbacteria bacterium]